MLEMKKILVMGQRVLPIKSRKKIILQILKNLLKTIQKKYKISFIDQIHLNIKEGTKE
jgi:hypothetical protein